MVDLNMDLGSNLGPEVLAPARVLPNVISDRVKIILEEDDNIPPTGLYVGVNGMGYMLRPGVELNIPRSVLEVLNNAVMSTPVIDPVSRRTVAYRSKRRYSYRMV